MVDLLSIPDEINELSFRRIEIQENPFTDTPQTIKWLCEVSDACPLDGTYNKKSGGFGDTQKEAYDKALNQFLSNE